MGKVEIVFWDNGYQCNSSCRFEIDAKQKDGNGEKETMKKREFWYRKVLQTIYSKINRCGASHSQWRIIVRVEFIPIPIAIAIPIPISTVSNSSLNSNDEKSPLPILAVLPIPPISIPILTSTPVSIPVPIPIPIPAPAPALVSCVTGIPVVIPRKRKRSEETNMNRNNNNNGNSGNSDNNNGSNAITVELPIWIKHTQKISPTQKDVIYAVLVAVRGIRKRYNFYVWTYGKRTPLLSDGEKETCRIKRAQCKAQLLDFILNNPMSCPEPEYPVRYRFDTLSGAFAHLVGNPEAPYYLVRFPKKATYHSTVSSDVITTDSNNSRNNNNTNEIIDTNVRSGTPKAQTQTQMEERGKTPEPIARNGFHEFVMVHNDIPLRWYRDNGAIWISPRAYDYKQYKYGNRCKDKHSKMKMQTQVQQLSS